MSVSVREIIASEQWKAAIDRVRVSLTQTVMSRTVTPEDRERALMKFHLLDELEVDLSQHIKE